MTQAKVEVVLSNGRGKRTVARYSVALLKTLPLEQLSPRADEALRAALKNLGIRLTSSYVPSGGR